MSSTVASETTTQTRCRFCESPLRHLFADLGMSPLSNRYLEEEELARMEPFYPLRALVCDSCFLVQLDEFESPESIFSNYAYFSSYSTTWLEHAKAYVELAVERFGLDATSKVVEVASNDGYLLQYFVERQIPVLGVEPAANVAAVANDRGIPTTVQFFGRETAEGLAADSQADLIVGNNVLAHVPDLNDFVAGLKVLLKPGGTITMEFPHLVRLIDERQFDTIYHEHFSYFSFLTARDVFAEHGLSLYDVEELPTHGGSLRIYAGHADDTKEPSERAGTLAQREHDAGLRQLSTYRKFASSVIEEKREILDFLISLKREGNTIAGYGAAAKGNTLLNFCGIRTDFLEYTADLNPHKQGRYLPGTHIPIRAPEALQETKPDIVFILPWNLRDEIMEQLSFVREWGGRFVARAPAMTLYE
jgi:SAM-dependent methyltransferase